jgi:hypothetical protein
MLVEAVSFFNGCCVNVVPAQLFVLLSPVKAGQVDTKEPKGQAETYYPDAAAGICDPHVSANALI